MRQSQMFREYFTRETERLRAAIRANGVPVGVQQCQGLDTGDLVDRVAQAVQEDDWPLLEEIEEQVTEYSSRPPEELPDGETQERQHGLVIWLWQLRRGHGSLPSTLPRDWLLSWRDGYRDHIAGATPIPNWRCETCCLILPNALPAGHGNYPEYCPSCGSVNLSYADLSVWPEQYRPILRGSPRQRD
jgi:hypothetical protein